MESKSERQKNFKYKKNKRSCKILSTMEEIYSRTIHIEEGERSGEYKGSSSRI